VELTRRVWVIRLWVLWRLDWVRWPLDGVRRSSRLGDCWHRRQFWVKLRQRWIGAG
jgi:hypothetical protein